MTREEFEKCNPFAVTLNESLKTLKAWRRDRKGLSRNHRTVLRDAIFKAVEFTIEEKLRFETSGAPVWLLDLGRKIRRSIKEAANYRIERLIRESKFAHIRDIDGRLAVVRGTLPKQPVLVEVPLIQIP